MPDPIEKAGSTEKPESTWKSLVCIGNLTIDEAVHGGVPSEPAMGGDAAYAALAARRILRDVTMLAPVGNDLPATVLDQLSAAGIAIDDLPERDLPTVRNTVTYHDDGSRTWAMHDDDAHFDALSVYPADVPGSVLDADGIVLSAMSLESQLALTPWLRQNSEAALYLDLQEDYLDGNREALLAIVAVCDVFLPSEIEAVALAGTTDLERAARFFAGLGPSVVVIKRADKGALVLENDTVTLVPSALVDAVDSTGAGDAFCGAFAAAHLLSGDAVEAANRGSEAARVAISDFGIAGLLRVSAEVRP
ncbi:carbohydrate kinase family protein [Frondihabitans sp. Leaf304]|uniref:carbohydrate kinase family protein n=1 Tax=Frondihabitans sp. Leaf304 TaxID=1736329 RepID=UPI00138F53E7|nr:carbohydrate kinase family protein [Frondihabitans sp. Leaf304]